LSTNSLDIKLYYEIAICDIKLEKNMKLGRKAIYYQRLISFKKMESKGFGCL